MRARKELMFIQISPGRAEGAGQPPGPGPDHAVLGFWDFAKFGRVIEDGADGAEADLRVLILEKVAEVKDSFKGEALEAAFGELGGLALQLGKLVAEFGVLEPTVQSAAAHFGEAGGLGRWRGRRREWGAPIAGVERGRSFLFQGRCEPWPQWPFDRFGRVLIVAY